MKRELLIFACALAWALGGCSGNALTQQRGTPADVNGFWGEDFGPTPVPGNSFVMTLQISAGAVTGTGSYSGEAGPYGLLTVSGSAVSDSVHLSIAREPNAIFTQLRPDTARFDGALITRDRIEGMIVRASAAAQPFVLVRLHIGDRP